MTSIIIYNSSGDFKDIEIERPEILTPKEFLEKY